MTPFWWALTFGGTLVAAAAVISVACLRAFAREDAEVAQLRADLVPLADVEDGVDLDPGYRSDAGRGEW
jgi:hypothetical protein